MRFSCELVDPIVAAEDGKIERLTPLLHFAATQIASKATQRKNPGVGAPGLYRSGLETGLNQSGTGPFSNFKLTKPEPGQSTEGL